MKHTCVASLILAVVALAAVPSAASAQNLGTFSWQLQPYCNRITVNVTQSGAIYTLDGFDDQCGAPQRASVMGTAFLNPDGTVGIGLNTVLSPGGKFVHVEARISLSTLAGPWRDSAGNVGTLVFTPLGGTGGSPRPVALNGLPPHSITAPQIAPGQVGAAQINPSQVQARISGSCAPGRAVQGVAGNGSVQCGVLGAVAYERDISGMPWTDYSTFLSLTIPAPNVLTAEALQNNIVLVYDYTSDFDGWGIVPYYTDRNIRVTAKVAVGAIILRRDQDGNPSTQSWHHKVRVVLVPIVAGGVLQ